MLPTRGFGWAPPFVAPTERSSRDQRGNASYGLSICAERVALFNAVARGLQPEELALSCLDAPADGPAGLRMPCGACRQVMQELLPAQATVHIDGVGSRRLAELLPDAFSLVAEDNCQ